MIKETLSALRKLEKRIEDCRNSPQSNNEYIEGLEHALRFIKLELHDALHESKDDNNVKGESQW